VEFLRFGSKIPGAYWGCCAICIIQNFGKDPDEKASIQIVHGDTGSAMQRNGKAIYAGPTYRDIFQTRIRTGTHCDRDMPNHIFLAALGKAQCETEIGQKWLAILKENGFEFIRTTDNSVYSGPNIATESDPGTPHPVHLFGLFRNIGRGRINDPFAPPAAWLELPEAKSQEEIWAAGETKFFTEDELKELGAPIILAGEAGVLPRPKPADAPTINSLRQAAATGCGLPTAEPVVPTNTCQAVQ